jgi:hypothetical protein
MERGSSPSEVVRKALITSPKLAIIHRFDLQYISQSITEIVCKTLLRIGLLDVDERMIEGCRRAPGHSCWLC